MWFCIWLPLFGLSNVLKNHKMCEVLEERAQKPGPHDPEKDTRKRRRIKIRAVDHNICYFVLQRWLLLIGSYHTVDVGNNARHCFLTWMFLNFDKSILWMAITTLEYFVCFFEWHNILYVNSYLILKPLFLEWSLCFLVESWKWVHFTFIYFQESLWEL